MRIIYRIEALIDEPIEIYVEEGVVWIYQGSERILFSSPQIEEVFRALEIIDNAPSDSRL